jgi:hypothetical protein
MMTLIPKKKDYVVDRMGSVPDRDLGILHHIRSAFI